MGELEGQAPVDLEELRDVQYVYDPILQASTDRASPPGPDVRMQSVKRAAHACEAGSPSR